MERNELLHILEVGLKAASPYNSQPWEFEFKDDRLLIFPKYVDHGFVGNFKIAIIYGLGALLENLSEGAKHHHYDMTYRLLGSTIQSDTALCEVLFKKTAETENYDISHVMARYTNRKKYKSQPVPSSVVEEIRSIFCRNNRKIIDVTNNHAFINACSVIERVRIVNAEFNEDLVENLCLTPKEAQERRTGLDLRVLELPLISRLFLKAARYAWFRRTVGRSFIAQNSAEKAKKQSLYSCPLVLAFRNTDDSFEAMMNDWKDIQKVLNLLQKHGLSSQLLASSPDLSKIKRGFYAQGERKLLNKADEAVEKALGFKMQTILTLVRIGYADECRFKSLRKDPEDLLRPGTK